MDETIRKAAEKAARLVSLLSWREDPDVTGYEIIVWVNRYPVSCRNVTASPSRQRPWDMDSLTELINSSIHQLPRRITALKRVAVTFKIGKALWFVISDDHGGTRFERIVCCRDGKTAIMEIRQGTSFSGVRSVETLFDAQEGLVWHEGARQSDVTRIAEIYFPGDLFE